MIIGQTGGFVKRVKDILGNWLSEFCFFWVGRAEQAEQVAGDDVVFSRGKVQLLPMEPELKKKLDL